MASRVKTGTCGIRMPLKSYGEIYPALEVQQTFYQPPQPKTLERWRTEVPETFEFTLKAWQLITHEASSPTYRRLKRPLSDVEAGQCGAFRWTPIVREGWEATRVSAEALGATRILFQCPARFTPTEEHCDDLRRFFGSIDRAGIVALWEPRGAWPEELIDELCRELDLVHVVDPLSATTVTPERPYYRLHGRTGFRYVYEEEELEDLASTLVDAELSYVFFNNVAMRQDAARFLEILRRRGLA